MTTPDFMLLWIDTETTGLDSLEHELIEIAWALSTPDGTLTKDITSEVLPSETIDWEDVHPAVVRMHTDNGLRAESLAKMDESGLPKKDDQARALYRDRYFERVQERVLKYLEGVEKDILFTPSTELESIEKTIHLAGSTVRFDYDFLVSHMPSIPQRLHYRLLDVSALLLFARVLGYEPEEPETPKTHRAADDLARSIALYRDLLRHFGTRGICGND